MTDVPALLAALEAYALRLSRAAETTRSDLAVLQDRWAALNEDFEGAAAEDFRQRWSASAERLAAFAEGCDRLRVLVEGKAAALRDFETLE